MNEFEKILDRSAKKHMNKWSLDSFRKTHPKLLNTIIDAMKEAQNQ